MASWLMIANAVVAGGDPAWPGHHPLTRSQAGDVLISELRCAAWPVRGIKPFALERVEWSGKMPFEINRVAIEPDGFKVTFTKPVEPMTGNLTDSYTISALTHPYHQGYGGPEIEQHQPGVTAVALAEDGLSVKISVETLQRGFVNELDLPRLRSRDNEALLHRHAFYTVNEIPSVPASPATARRSDPTQHPVSESPQWLTYPGEKGPGAGKHIVLIAADQEYRSEYAMPMLARLLAKHHGFHTTVLFSLKAKCQSKVVTRVSVNGRQLVQGRLSQERPMIQNSGGEAAARDGVSGASWGVVAGGSEGLWLKTAM